MFRYSPPTAREKKEFWGSKDDTVIEFNKALKFSWIQTTANLNGSAFSIFIYLR